jgi:hypothetical protein
MMNRSHECESRMLTHVRNHIYAATWDAIIAPIQTLALEAASPSFLGGKSLTLWAGNSLNSVPEPHFWPTKSVGRQPRS